MADSDFNLQKLTTKELSFNLKATIEFGGNVMIVGRRGSGKTEITKQAIASTGYSELYLNMSVLERPDLGGYPDFSASSRGKKYVEFLLPAFYERLIEGNEKVVVVLDEVDKAEAALWAPLLEFTQFRSMNGRRLRNLHAVVMTGNLASEGGHRPCLPLLDRAEKFMMTPNVQDWIDWGAVSGEIHPSITAYINDHPEDLFGDVDPGDSYADASPRGWHNSSKIISFGEKNQWSPKLLKEKVSGYVGKKIGIKYASYFEHYATILPMIDDIMNGKRSREFSGLDPSRQMVGCMIACARLSRILDQHKEKAKKDSPFPKEVYNVGNFIKDVDPEMALISVRSQIGVHRTVETGLDEDEVWSKILHSFVDRIG